MLPTEYEQRTLDLGRRLRKRAEEIQISSGFATPEMVKAFGDLVDNKCAEGRRISRFMNTLIGNPEHVPQYLPQRTLISLAISGLLGT